MMAWLHKIVLCLLAIGSSFAHNDYPNTRFPPKKNLDSHKTFNEQLHSYQDQTSNTRDEVSDFADFMDGLHWEESHKPTNPYSLLHKPKEDIQEIRPHTHPFDGYREIWLGILQELYKIIKDKSILYDSDLSEQMLDQMYYLLEDVKVLQDHSDVQFCPKSYYKQGKLCLAVNDITHFLDYREARLYCQVLYGGDLAIFRDANEFADIQNYIKKIAVCGATSKVKFIAQDQQIFRNSRKEPGIAAKIPMRIFADDGNASVKHYLKCYEKGKDPEDAHSFWIGLSDQEKENDWRFIDGRIALYDAPFWGSTIRNCDYDSNYDCRMKKTLRYGDTDTNVKEFLPEMNNEYKNYAVLYNQDHHYIHDASYDEAESWNTVPLCQFIPDRDTKNLQYGEAVADQWPIDQEPWLDVDNPHKEDYHNLRNNQQINYALNL